MTAGGWPGGAVTVAGERVSYILRRMARRKQVHLVVGPEGELEVRAPRRFSHASAQAAIHANGAWVVKALRRAREEHAQRPALETGATVPLLDEALELLVDAQGPHRVWRDGDRLHVVSPGGDPRPPLEAWYRRRAWAYLPGRLAALGQPMGLAATGVSIRGQRTRWGSCSSRGTISLNWRLMLLPSRLVDYVLVHELCHLRELNHSPRFWALVEEVLPDFAEQRTRLKATPPSMVL